MNDFPPGTGQPGAGGADTDTDAGTPPLLLLLHITPRTWWEAALAAGVYAPPSLADEGFIHLSTPAQVLRTAHAFYRGQRGLMLLAIAPARLQAAVRYEPADGDLFPHLYGPLNPDAVVAAHPFEPDAAGDFSLPEPLDPRCGR